MPTTSPVTAATLPAASDPADLRQILTSYDLSVLRPLQAASDTQAEQRRSGITGTCLVWRTDLRQLHAHPNTGGAGERWIYVGGECHGEYRGSVATIPTGTPFGSGALTTISGATTTPAPGSVSGETVTLSRAGVYQITADADLQVITTGRAFVEVRANGSTVARAPMTGDDRATAAITRRFAAGTAIQMVAYHSQGSTVAVDQLYLTITRLQ